MELDKTAQLRNDPHQPSRWVLGDHDVALPNRLGHRFHHGFRIDRGFGLIEDIRRNGRSRGSRT